MDWKALITELHGLGLNQVQIAAACKCGQTTISELFRGVTSDPRHSTGEALKELLRTKRAEAAEKAAAPQTAQLTPGAAAAPGEERRLPDRVHPYPDLDRRAAAVG